MSRSAKKKQKKAPGTPAEISPVSPTPVRPSKSVPNRQRWIIAALLFLITLAVFWPCLNNDFVNCDDELYVTENPHVQHGFTAQEISWSFETFYASNWHPLTWLSHILAWNIFGPKPAGHHFVNILLHAVNAAILFLLLELMTGARWKSVAVAALFALHPLRVESVAWIAERKDVLCATFWFLTIWAHVRYARLRQSGERFGIWYGGVVLFFVLALLSKPMVVTLPFALLLVDYWPLGRLKQWRAALLEKIPLFALTAASCGVTYLAQKTGGAVGARVPVYIKIETALLGYFRYLGKMFWPTHLAMQYPYPHQWPVGAVGLSAAGLLIISALAIFYWKKWPWLPVGWFWYLGTLVPVIGLVQVGLQSIADRYTYIPEIGITIVLVWGACELWQRWRLPMNVLAVPAIAVIVVCSFLTRQQISYWQNSRTLFTHAVQVTTDNYSAYEYLGDYEFKHGTPQAAMDAFVKTLEIDPKNEEANTGVAYLLFFKAGKRDAAIELLEKAVQLKPNSPTLRINLGLFYKENGRYADAEAQLREGLKLKPNSAEADVGLAYICLKDGRRDEAISLLKNALQARPDLKVAEKMLKQATDGTP